MQKSLFTLWTHRQAVGHLAVDRPKTSQSAISCVCDTISRIKSRRTICICSWPNDNIHCMMWRHCMARAPTSRVIDPTPDDFYARSFFPGTCINKFVSHSLWWKCFATMVQEGKSWARMKFTFELLAGVRELNGKLAEIFGRNNTSRDFIDFRWFNQGSCTVLFIRLKEICLKPRYIVMHILNNMTRKYVRCNTVSSLLRS